MQHPPLKGLFPLGYSQFFSNPCLLSLNSYYTGQPAPVLIELDIPCL